MIFLWKGVAASIYDKRIKDRENKLLPGELPCYNAFQCVKNPLFKQAVKKMPPNKIKLLGGCLLLLLIVAGTLTLLSQGLSTAPEVSFKYIDDGRQVNLKHLGNRPVLVTFWATSCPGCMKEIPHLIALYNALSAQGLEIVGVAMSYDPPDRVLALTRHRNIPYPITLDLDGSIARAFDDVTLTPTTFLIAPGGRIIAHIVGELDMEKLHRQISDLLIESQVTSHKSQVTSHKSQKSVAFPYNL